MASRRTNLLIALVAVAGLCSILAAFRFSKLRAVAAEAKAQLHGVRQDIELMQRWRSSPGRATAVPPDLPEINRRLREAAVAAGLADAPESDPGTPQRIRTSDYNETRVFLNFGTIGMRELLAFLYQLSKADPTARIQQVELSPPIDGRAGEVWQGGVIVSYLTYAPQKAETMKRE